MEAQGAWILEESIGTMLDFVEEPGSRCSMEDSWVLVQSVTAGMLEESATAGTLLDFLEEPKTSRGMEDKDSFLEDSDTTYKLLEYLDGPARAASCFLETDQQDSLEADSGPTHAESCSLETDQQDSLSLDSGFQSGSSSTSHSRKTSESNGLEWALNDADTPSVFFPSYGINPRFNTWSPSSEDDLLLAALSGTKLSGSHWESDSHEWGDFKDWDAVPSPAEAAILLQLQKKQEEIIHTRAAAKRSLKKALFFARVYSNKIKSKPRL